MSLPPEAPARSDASITFDLSQLPGAATAFGVSLLSSAVVVSTLYSREGGDLDWSNFTLGVLATLALLGFAAGAHVLPPAADRSDTLVSWPGAFGAVGAGLMVAVLIDDDPASTYVGALMVIALSVAGYVLTRTAPFVVSTILGLAALYGQVFDDVIDTDGDGANTFMIIGAGVLVFVLGVTALGWLLPATRVLSAMVVGVGGLGAMVGVLAALSTARVFRTAFVGPEFDDSQFEDGSYSDLESMMRQHDPYKNDVYVVLLYCVVLALLWIACSLATGHVGFRLLVAATAVVIIPLATYAVITKHPTWWEVVPGVLGALVLFGVAFQAMARPATTPPVAPS